MSTKQAKDHWGSPLISPRNHAEQRHFILMHDWTSEYLHGMKKNLMVLIVEYAAREKLPLR